MAEGEPIALIIHAQTNPPLKELDEEAANIRDALLKSGLCEPHILLAASADRIFQELNERGDRVVAIHYAGHANGEGVLLPSGERSNPNGQLSHIEGLAGRLKQLKKLRVVFLNGCATRDQVTDLLEAGVPAVIATLRGIDDAVARDFATAFYDSLSTNHSIDEALQAGESRVQERRGGSVRGAYLEQFQIDQGPEQWPWKLYATNEAKAWKLQDAVLQNGATNGAVQGFQAEFKATVHQLQVLGAYKDLHDMLHAIQFRSHHLLVNEVRKKNSSEIDWYRVDEASATLREKLATHSDFAEKSILPKGDTTWIFDLGTAAHEIEAAFEQRDAKILKKAEWSINRVMSRRPAEMNVRLNDQARSLCLGPLLERLKPMSDQFQSKDGGSFGEALQELGILDKKLKTLVELHDGWQQVDLELRLLQTMKHDPCELEMGWETPNRMVTALCTAREEPWVKRIERAARELDDAIAQGSARQMESAFHSYYREASTRFYLVDHELKRLCSEMRDLGDRMSALLNDPN